MATARIRSFWQRVVGGRPIVTRLVLAVAVAMTLVLLAATGFVYWRVEYALNRQLNQDLRAWTTVVNRTVAVGATPPTGTPGLKYQTYSPAGMLVDGSRGLPRLASPARIRDILAGEDDDYDLGSFIPAAAHPYRVRPTVVRTPEGTRVVLAAISRAHHDEALRELDAAARHRLPADPGGGVPGRLRDGARRPEPRRGLPPRSCERPGRERRPAADRGGRDDELTRLGHTFNALLERIDDGSARERQFLADAAHELRTPLTLMTTELEWATHRQRDAEQVRKVLSSLQGQVARLVDLANTLLDIEELRAGSLHREMVDVGELVDGARRDALPPDADLRLEVDDPGAVVFVDTRWMTIAIANLLRNARRHGAGPVTLTARAAGGGLDLTVADEGPGFAPGFRDHAFDRFSRAEESRTTPGSGLGLHLVQAVATAHGGHAEILPGPGGRVHLVVPPHDVD